MVTGSKYAHIYISSTDSKCELNQILCRYPTVQKSVVSPRSELAPN